MNIIEAQVVLTPVEARHKRRLEAVIRHNVAEGQRHFLIAGRALLKIQDERLFKDECPSIDAYIEKYYGVTGRHGRRLIEAAKTDLTIRKAGAQSLPSERISRVLTDGLNDPLERSNAVLLAQEAAAAIIPSGQVTRALMEEAVDLVAGMRTTKGMVDLGDGQMRNATGALIIKHNERVQAAIDEAQARRAAKKNGGKSTPGFHVDDDLLVLKASARIWGAYSKRAIIIEFANEQDADVLKAAHVKGQAGVIVTIKKAKAQ